MRPKTKLEIDIGELLPGTVRHDEAGTKNLSRVALGLAATHDSRPSCSAMYLMTSSTGRTLLVS
jgi:hypothetical protein